MTFARRVFLVASVYGFIVVIPQYFLEARYSRDFPPPITHVEYYYGFVGIALAWQIAFYVISRDPIRYRALMIPAVVEKAGFGLPAVVLYARGRLSAEMLGAGLLDLIFGVFFIAAYLQTPSAPIEAGRSR
jgi:hypothetical protein